MISDMAAIVKALSRKNVRRVIGLSMAGLSGEVPAALEKWTEDGVAPDYIIGKAGKEYPDQNKEQPLCPYPKVATYIGGDKNKASSFECK